MNSVSTIIAGMFVILTAICIAVVKKLCATSFFIASGIGIPLAFVLGMMTIWFLGKLKR